MTELAVSLDHLWADDSSLIITLQEALDLRRVKRKGFGDPTDKILITKLKLWNRVLTALAKEEHNTADAESIQFYLSTIRQLLGD